MTLVLQWRCPRPGLETRWRGRPQLGALPQGKSPLPLAAIIGLPGRDAIDSILVSFTAAEPIGGHRVVYVGADELARLATPANAAAMGPAGVSLNAAAAGGAVRIRSAGIIEEQSWAWQPGPIYLGPAGSLVQQPPSSGAIYQVGVSVGPHRLRFIPLLVAQQLN